MSSAGDAFISTVVRRALEDQLLRSTEDLREWFRDFVDLYEEELDGELTDAVRNDPRAKPASGPGGGGRKKSIVFNMLQGSGGPLGGSSSGTGGGGSGARTGRGARARHGSGAAGSAAKRMMLSQRDEEVDASPSEAPVGFSNLAARRKSRAVDLGALRASGTDSSGLGGSSRHGRARPPSLSVSQMRDESQDAAEDDDDGAAPHQPKRQGSSGGVKKVRRKTGDPLSPATTAHDSNDGSTVHTDESPATVNSGRAEALPSWHPDAQSPQKSGASKGSAMKKKPTFRLDEDDLGRSPDQDGSPDPNQPNASPLDSEASPDMHRDRIDPLQKSESSPGTIERLETFSAFISPARTDLSATPSTAGSPKHPAMALVSPAAGAALAGAAPPASAADGRPRHSFDKSDTTLPHAGSSSEYADADDGEGAAVAEDRPAEQTPGTGCIDSLRGSVSTSRLSPPNHHPDHSTVPKLPSTMKRQHSFDKSDNPTEDEELSGSRATRDDDDPLQEAPGLSYVKSGFAASAVFSDQSSAVVSPEAAPIEPPAARSARVAMPDEDDARPNPLHLDERSSAASPTVKLEVEMPTPQHRRPTAEPQDDVADGGVAATELTSPAGPDDEEARLSPLVAMAGGKKKKRATFATATEPAATTSEPPVKTKGARVVGFAQPSDASEPVDEPEPSAPRTVSFLGGTEENAAAAAAEEEEEEEAAAPSPRPRGVSFVPTGFADDAKGSAPVSPATGGGKPLNWSASGTAEQQEQRKKRLVSFGALSVRSDGTEDSEDANDAGDSPSHAADAPPQSAVDGGGDEEEGGKKGLLKSASMGVRLIKKLTMKQSVHNLNRGSANDADKAFSNFGSGEANNTSGDAKSSNNGSMDAWKNRRSFSTAGSNASELDLLSDSASISPSLDDMEDRIANARTFLELKKTLTEDRYFTIEQLKLQHFQRVAKAFAYGLADFSAALIFFTAFAVAARVGLGSSKLDQHFVYGEMTLDIINFFLVFGVNLFLPFEEQGQVRSDITVIVKRYLSTPRFAVFDVISTFPVLTIAAAAGYPQAEWARLNLLLREIKMPGMLEKIEEQLPATLHPSVMRLLGYFLYLILIITHIATFLMFVMRQESREEVLEWTGLDKDSQFHGNPWFWFSRMWRDTLGLIADRQMAYPRTDLEVIVALIAVMLALITLAVILASFEEIIVTEIEDGNVLGKKVDDAIAAMDFLGVSEHLKGEIIEYYKSMWDINRSFDFNTDDVLAELPDALHDDIEFECNARIIRSIPLFADVAMNSDFVHLLAGELQQIVIMPGAPIVTRGEDGDCMFFISAGVCAVMSEDGSEEVTHLGAGSFFGEVTLLFGGERDRTIIAKTLCVCYVVTDVQFEDIVEEYPEALDRILKSAVRQMKQTAVAIEDVDDTELGALMEESAGDFTSKPGHEESMGADELMSDDEIRQMMASRMKFSTNHRRSHAGGTAPPGLGGLGAESNDPFGETFEEAGDGDVVTPRHAGSHHHSVSHDGGGGANDGDDPLSPNLGTGSVGFVSQRLSRSRSTASEEEGEYELEAPEQHPHGLQREDSATSNSSRRRSSNFAGGGLNFVVRQRNRRQSVGFALKEAFET